MPEEIIKSASKQEDLELINKARQILGKLTDESLVIINELNFGQALYQLEERVTKK